ncbi:glycoside hydrolase family 10 protein [Chroococcidiopsis sp. FACHB-1243]|uniref:glycoside hydrolase family 10 protein n=1 Tax=Chroococcidiopsis sp. [FACHB-1243] TaxID=2692781 RepID=UPI0017812DE9|nr:glycoside hydrolase family 10 protein [Chroococcidiopsis sp. [FACHB-1243]]MBD2305363.1 glycoside hydrolase family 10 protein [Chroococcidiopsis sp. [FACHB-1243]]
MRRKFFAPLAIALFSLAAILCLSPITLIASPTLPKPNSNSAEIRGVWLTNIDSDVLFKRDRLSQAIQTLHRLNFNTIYPTIWNWGYTLYPSSVAANTIGRSLDPTPGLQGRDILQEIIQQGHQQNALQGDRQRMGVIPWFEFGFMAPADSQLAKRHPQWLTRRQNNQEIWLEGKHKRVWLNPFHPEVQQFIQSLILEVVTKYDIDGIQFDDHFGLPSEFGYDPFTVNLYQQEHQGKKPPIDPQDSEWLRWRADKITAFLKQVFQVVKQQKPNCIISIAPNPQRVSYDLFLADWADWDRQGLVEELVLQVYRNDLKVFLSELQYPEVEAARKHIPVGIGILSGLKGKYVPWGQIQNQVQVTRRHNFAGISFFFYETLWNLAKESPEKRQLGFQKLFSLPTNRPNTLVGWQTENSSRNAS